MHGTGSMSAAQYHGIRVLGRLGKFLIVNVCVALHERHSTWKPVKLDKFVLKNVNIVIQYEMNMAFLKQPTSILESKALVQTVTIRYVW